MTTCGDVRLRLSESQKKQLKIVAEAQGYKTLSEFARQKLFQDLSVHEKLNLILKKLDEKHNKGDVK